MNSKYTGTLESTIKNMYRTKQVEQPIEETGHADVASMKQKVEVAFNAVSKMKDNLNKIPDEGNLPTWWTNKVAVAVDKLDGMSDYLDTTNKTEALDPVNPKAVKKKFDDRKDKDIDNDGDTDSTDKYLHKKRKAISKAIKKDEQNGKKDSIEVNPKDDNQAEAMKPKTEKVEIPDKMTTKLDKIVKSLKKSVKGHAKQAQTIGKLAGMDKVDERALTDKEMKKREDVAQAIKRDNPKMPMDQKMAIATSVAKKTKGEDIIRHADVKMVKFKDPATGQMRFKRQRPEIKVGEAKMGAKTTMVTPKGKEAVRRIPVKHLAKYLKKGYVEAEAVVEAVSEAMNYKVSIEDLPDFYISADNPGEVKIKMRKLLKKPNMLQNVQRVPDAAMKKHFRLKAQGKEEDEQSTQKESIMSENKLVNEVSRILSSGRMNVFRDARKMEEEIVIDEKMSSKEKMAKGLYNEKGMTDKAPGDQDAGAKAMQSKVVADKQKAQDKKIPQGASTLHMCAKNVMHEKYGRGECIYGMHADPDENGHVSHYDIMFNHGIEKDMSITECEVLHERNHGMKGHNKDKKEK